MNDVVQNQGCDGSISVLVGAYHIYSDGLTLSDNPALFKEGSMCVYYLIISASHAYIIIPYINKKYDM